MARARPAGIPAEGEIIVGKYRVEGILGQGGMGVVVAAQHLALEQRVAVKFLLPEATELPDARQRFLREARAAASIQSEHVARVLDVGEIDSGALYLVMEHLTGTDLREMLHLRGTLPPGEAVDYVLEACEGMAEAHAVGIVHRDLKPANLFLATRAGSPPVLKVLDFGISKAIGTGAGDADANLTSTGTILGSFHYMAPEQLRGLKLADARADIWSLGVILYQLVSGRLPYEGESSTEMVFKLKEEQPAPLRSLGYHLPGLEAVILSCLEMERDRRPQTIVDLARALLPFATARGTQSVERIARGAEQPSAPPPESDDAGPSPESTLPGPNGPNAGVPESPLPGPNAGAMSPSSTAPALRAPARRARIAAIVLAGLIGALGLSRLIPWLRRPSSQIDAERLASFAPVPAEPKRLDAMADERVRLGRTLFYDPRLSKNSNVSCASCHPLDAYGVDNKRLSRGSEDKEPPRNTLSVYNVAGFFVLLWDGRKDNLVEQAKEVLLSPRAMAASPERLTAALASSPPYVSAFAKAFPEDPTPVSFDNTARALAAFQETLFTSGSRWDRFLEGDRTAITDREKAGFNRFVEVGCVACHFGPYVGATMFQKLGLVKAWPDSRDRGRYEITKRDVDWMVFRVPSLRNVERTAPYFHDGSIASLEETIRIMARHQIGRELDDDDVGLIASWLSSLTGQIPRSALDPASAGAR